MFDITTSNVAKIEFKSEKEISEDLFNIIVHMVFAIIQKQYAPAKVKTNLPLKSLHNIDCIFIIISF